MRISILAIGLVFVMAGSGFAVAHRQDQQVLNDLDLYEQMGVLDSYLEDELDDVFERYHPESLVDIDNLYVAIMDALEDAGDEGDETYINYDDLVYELVEEAGTSLERVVWDALMQADRESAAPQTSPFRFASWPADAASQSQNRYSQTGLGTFYARQGIRGGVRSR